MNYDQQPKPSRYSINNIFGALAALFIILLMVGAFSELASAGTKQVQVGTIVGHKFSFSQEGDIIVQSAATQVIKDVLPTTCVEEAAALQQIYRTIESNQAGDLYDGEWVVKSYAFCTLVSKTVDYPDTGEPPVVVEGVCEIQYDPTNAATAREQLIAQCLS